MGLRSPYIHHWQENTGYHVCPLSLTCIVHQHLCAVKKNKQITLHIYMLHIYTDCSSSYLTHSTYCLEIITINTFISVNCWWTSTWVLLFYSYVINMSCAEWNPESLSECGLLWFKKHGRYHTKSSLDKSLGPIWPFTWNLNVNVNGLPSNWLFSCRLIFPLSLLLEHNKCAPPIIIAGWYLRHPPGLSLASRRQWHQKKKRKKEKGKKKNCSASTAPPPPTAVQPETAWRDEPSLNTAELT